VAKNAKNRCTKSMSIETTLSNAFKNIDEFSDNEVIFIFLQ